MKGATSSAIKGERTKLLLSSIVKVERLNMFSTKENVGRIVLSKTEESYENDLSKEEEIDAVGLYKGGIQWK